METDFYCEMARSLWGVSGRGWELYGVLGTGKALAIRFCGNMATWFENLRVFILFLGGWRGILIVGKEF